MRKTDKKNSSLYTFGITIGSILIILIGFVIGQMIAKPKSTVSEIRSKAEFELAPTVAAAFPLPTVSIDKTFWLTVPLSGSQANTIGIPPTIPVPTNRPTVMRAPLPGEYMAIDNSTITVSNYDKSPLKDGVINKPLQPGIGYYFYPVGGFVKATEALNAGSATVGVFNGSNMVLTGVLIPTVLIGSVLNLQITGGLQEMIDGPNPYLQKMRTQTPTAQVNVIKNQTSDTDADYVLRFNQANREAGWEMNPIPQTDLTLTDVDGLGNLVNPCYALWKKYAALNLFLTIYINKGEEWLREDGPNGAFLGNLPNALEALKMNYKVFSTSDFINREYADTYMTLLSGGCLKGSRSKYNIIWITVANLLEPSLQKYWTITQSRWVDLDTPYPRVELAKAYMNKLKELSNELLRKSSTQEGMDYLNSQVDISFRKIYDHWLEEQLRR